jgi:hypothetical protein
MGDNTAASVLRATDLLGRAFGRHRALLDFCPKLNDEIGWLSIDRLLK